MKRTILATLSGLALSGCMTSSIVSAPVRAPPVRVPTEGAGLSRVIGQPATGLIAMFGQPDADIREGTARKLQFQSNICVLDAYLYPQGPRDPVVTYVDAREPDGSTIDKASCVSALQLRKAAH